MMATGFSARTVAGVMFAEAVALTVPAAVLGVPLGVAYAAGMGEALGA